MLSERLLKYDRRIAYQEGKRDQSRQEKNKCQSNKTERPDRQVSAGRFLLCWFARAGGLLVVVSLWNLRVDPYMHFHAPLTERYYYSLKVDAGMRQYQAVQL